MTDLFFYWDSTKSATQFKLKHFELKYKKFLRMIKTDR